MNPDRPTSDAPATGAVDRPSSTLDDIIDALAAAEGVDPVDLECSLGEFVDVDALVALLDRPTTTCRLAFRVATHEVVVHEDGTVIVDGGVRRGSASRATAGQGPSRPGQAGASAVSPPTPERNK